MAVTDAVPSARHATCLRLNLKSSFPNAVGGVFGGGAMEWYYADGGQRVGPVNDTEFQTLCASGKIKPATLVWKAGMAEWQPLNAVNSSVSATATAPGAFGVSAYCTQCGRHFAATDLLTFGAARVCAGCKETFFQHLREQGT